MKTFFLSCLIGLASFLQSRSQVINQLTIIPANPTATDTITVIWDLTYNGNCTFGMVSVYSFTVDSTIYIAPTYCGYFDTTICNSIDTFKIDPLMQGNYTLNLEIHQGSICPVSGFDATIAEVDTGILVTPLSGVSEEPLQSSLIIAPNPATNQITINGFPVNSMIRISDVTGKIIMVKKIQDKNQVVDISVLSPGIYFLTSEYEVKMLLKM